jgi:hypothetical protein
VASKAKKKPAKFEAELRRWLMLQGGQQDAPIKVCAGATLVAITRNPWTLHQLITDGRFGSALGRYLQQLSEPAKHGGGKVDDHQIRLLAKQLALDENLKVVAPWRTGRDFC